MGKNIHGLVWVVRFYGISIFVGYLTPNPFYVNNHIYPTPPLGQDMTQGQFFSGV